MNIDFNNYNAIIEQSVELKKLKDELEFSCNYTNLIHIHNKFVENDSDALEFILRKGSDDLRQVNFIKDGVAQINSIVIYFNYIPQKIRSLFKSNEDIHCMVQKEDEVNFLSKCVKSDVFKKFRQDFSHHLNKKLVIDENIKRSAYEQFREIELNYSMTDFQLNTKKLYYKFTQELKVINPQAIEVYFERGIKLEENKMLRLDFILPDNTVKSIAFSFPFAFYFSNMLSKNAQIIDVADIDNLMHKVTIKNNPEGWDDFNQSFLEDYYQEFKATASYQKLSQNLSDDKSPAKAKKI